MFSIAMLFLFVLLPFAEALSISNATVQASDRYAIINWQTDENASSTVLYGTNVTKLTLTKTSSVLEKNHALLISQLKNNTAYYFNVSSTNATVTATAGPFNFTTTLKDTIIPFIDVKLPEYYGSTTLSVTVRTEPNTEVYVYIDGNLSGAGFGVTGVDGVITLTGIRLKSGTGKITPNTVKIVAIDPSKNRNEITKIVNVDKTPPAITFDKPIPAAWGAKTLTIKGGSDETATMEVYLDGKLLQTINISSPWQTTINFDKGDRDYVLRLYAVDRAGNVFEQNYVIFVDTKDLVLDKHNIDDLTPSYIPIRTVRGKTKPGATVIVIVNNKTTDDALEKLRAIGVNATAGAPGFSVPFGLQEAIARLSRKELKYLTTADERGNFEVEIELTNEFRITQQEFAALPTPLRGAEAVSFDIGDTWKNTVEIIVVDRPGRVKSSGPKAVLFTRCGLGGFFTISAPQTSPAGIPEPILKEGHGQFSMTMDLKWGGSTDRKDVVVETPKISVQSISREEQIRKYNLTLGVGYKPDRWSIFPPQITPDTNQLYVLVHLPSTKHDFAKGFKGKDLTKGNVREKLDLRELELEFPLVLELAYTYIKPGTTERSERIVQKKCIDVKIQVEPELTDFFNPNDFLISTAANLNHIVREIDNLLNKYIRPAQRNTLLTCGGLIGVEFIINTVVRVQCLSNKVTAGDVREKLTGECKVEYAGGKPTCSASCTDDVRACCEATVNSLWAQELRQAACDRVLCRNVPSFERHVNTYSDLLVKRPVSRGQVSAKAPSLCSGIFKDFTGFNPDEGGCKEEFSRGYKWVSVLDWPYQMPDGEFDIAKKALERQKTITTTAPTTILETPEIFPGIGPFLGEVFSDNICAEQAAFKEKIISVKQSGDKSYGFKITPPEYVPAQGVQAEQKIAKVFFGEIKEVAEFETDPATGLQREIRKKLDIVDGGKEIFYDNQGYCTKESIPDCREAVAFKNANLPNPRLPDDVLRHLTLQPSRDYVFNPTANLIVATKSICIPAVNGQLTSFRNVLSRVSACFTSIAQTGRGNSPQCNALLSEVVCDFVIDAIQCGVRSIAGFSFGTSGFQFSPLLAPALAAETMTEVITNQYGDTAAYRTLFNENALLHSVCIGALTGDWNIEGVSDLLTQATILPTDSVCAIYPANRRFVTSNPLKQGRTSYIYYVGGMLAAGADISSLSLELVCSTDNSCNRYGERSNPLGKCDCFGMPKEQTVALPIREHSVKQGGVFEDAKYLPLNDADIRYDKARLTYSYKDNTGQLVTKDCQAQLKEDGFIPPTCTFGASGFRCEFSVDERGTAKFIVKPKPKVEEEGIYRVGKSLGIPMRVEVLSPKDNPIPKYVGYVIRNQHGVALTDAELQYPRQLDEGVRTYEEWPGFTIKKEHFQKTAVISRDITPRNEPSGVITDRTTIQLDPRVLSGEYIVLFNSIDVENKTGTYTCYEASTDKDGKVIVSSNVIAETGKFSSTDLVKCKGLQFNLAGNIEKITPTAQQLTQGTKFDSITGTAYYVKFKRGETGSSAEECPDKPVEWTADITLYHAEQTSGTGASGWSFSRQPVSDSGEIQEKRNMILQVRCKEPVAPEALAPFKLQEFEIVGAKDNIFTVSATDTKFKIKYLILATAEVTSLKLQVGTEIIELPKPSGIGQRSEQEVDLKDILQKLKEDNKISLIVNSATLSTTFSVKKS